MTTRIVSPSSGRDPERHTVALLGGSGFVGGSIRELLTRRGFTVLAPSSGECDLLQPRGVAEYFSRFRGPLQVVFCAGVVRSAEDSFESMEKNIRMIHNLTAGLSRERLVGLIYLSSADVYGRAPRLPITEETPVAPAGFYGISKLCGEMLLRLASRAAYPVTVLRLPGIYGPRDGYRSVVGQLVSQTLKARRVTLLGAGSAQRDYVEVSDVCEVVSRLLTAPWNGTLNVATGASCTIRELVKRIAQRAGVQVSVEDAPASESAAGDLVFEIAKLKSVLPGIALKNLDEGITEYLASTRRPERKVGDG